MMVNFFSVVDLSHSLIKQYLKPGAICVDATCGNGKDTLFLSNIVGQDGFVYAFDIQKQACMNTSSLLRRNGVINVKVMCDSHDQVKAYIKQPIDCVVFNLGYLPNAEPSIITLPETTICAMDSMLKIMTKDGIMVISSYVEHKGGLSEYKKIYKYLKKLKANHFQIMVVDQPNQQNNAPKIFFIKKKVDF